MLIVYQSLESTATKQDTGLTVLTGNSFKKGVKPIPSCENSGQFSLEVIVHEQGKNITKRQKLIDFASSQDSKQYSEEIKLEKDEKAKKKLLLEFLEKVIYNIKLSVGARTVVNSVTRHPDIIIFGEMYGSDLVGETISGYKVMQGINLQGDARQRFTVLQAAHTLEEDDITRYVYHGKVTTKSDETALCLIMHLRGWLTAFVHTPNSICNDDDKAIAYLRNNIQSALNQTPDLAGAHLDLLIGDTNQGSNSKVSNYLNKYDSNTWETSIVSGKQEITGPDGVKLFTVDGTNSTYSKHFDIACSRHASINFRQGAVVGGEDLLDKTDPAFLFHGLTGKHIELNDKLYPYSDHNGVIVEIRQDKFPHVNTDAYGVAEVEAAYQFQQKMRCRIVTARRDAHQQQYVINQTRKRAVKRGIEEVD